MWHTCCPVAVVECMKSHGTWLGYGVRLIFGEMLLIPGKKISTKLFTPRVSHNLTRKSSLITFSFHFGGILSSYPWSQCSKSMTRALLIYSWWALLNVPKLPWQICDSWDIGEQLCSHLWSAHSPSSGMCLLCFRHLGFYCIKCFYCANCAANPMNLDFVHSFSVLFESVPSS